MEFILEADGPVLNIEPSYRAAYDAVCQELGMPRLNAAEFWRAVRRGASDGELVRGAKPAKLAEFRRRFDAWLASPAVQPYLEPQVGASAALASLRRTGLCYLVTAGGDRAARQAVLDSHDLSVHFTRMQGLSVERSVRERQLRELARSDPRCAVAASSETLILAAEEAGLFAVGISCGACTPARLTRAGARVVLRDLDALADSVSSGARELVQAGFVPRQPRN